MNHQNPNSKLDHSRRERGVALVIVLAFVVLLTGLVVAYFSRSLSDRKLSNSSFNQAKADELARSALDILTGDLKQEIADPAASTATTNNGVTIYSPLPVTTSGTTTYPSMVPATNIPAVQKAKMPSLIRISGNTALAAPGVDRAASSAPTTGTSANGRSVSPARWNKHYLLPLNDTSKPTDTTPDGSFTPPSWIYVTGTAGPASPPLTAPATSVIGRYAYAIYDEGALLDVNVAGYPSALPASSPHPAPDTNNFKQFGYAGKGGLAFADLTQLKDAGGTSLITQIGINNLVGWRNNATAKTTGTFNNFTINTAGAASYYDTVLTGTNGFMKVSGTTSGGRTDQAFLGRQELIDFVMATGTADFNPNALQYLGTFSRAVNAPTWSPSADSTAMPGYLGGTGTSPVAYKANADSAGSANRNLANLRFSNPGTITHYKDDGTHDSTSDYAVQAGDPLIQRRFSLAKLAWLTHTGNASGISDAAVQACFGLRWNSSQARWDYVGPSGGTAQSSIKTLDQVAAENREPNFFELLKAGILSGSLGKDPGAACSVGYSAVDHPGTTEGAIGPGFDQYSPNKDKQIIQIGANIIDQSDTNSYPTAIYFPIAPDPASPEQGPINMCYGVENLPYLSDLNNISLVYAPNKYGGWWQPVLWNPHQAPTPNSTGLRPSKFKIVAYGQAWIQYSSTAGDIRQSTTLDFNARADHAMIFFADTGGTSSAFYARPTGLNITNADTGQTDPINVWQTGYNTLSSGYYPTEDTEPNLNKFVGFCAGTVPSPEAPTPIFDVPLLGIWRSHRIIPNPLVTFCLQYSSDGGTTFLPYAYMSRIGTYTMATSATVGRTAPKAFYDTLDPRTDRFSAVIGNGGFSSSHYTNPHSNYTFNYKKSTQAQTMTYPRQSSGFTYLPAPASGNGVYLGEWTQNQVDPDGNGKYSSYVDRDGILRPGDGFRRNENVSGDYGNGCVLYHADQPTASSPSVSARRPVILDRPFRSVGELGYAYRDLPFKTLDFWSNYSADAALLDLFSVSNEPVVVAGQINPNNAPAPVLQAIIAGTMNNESTSPQVTFASAGAQQIAAQLASTTPANPLRNRAGLAGAVSGAIDAILTGSSPIQDLRNKAYGEAPVRALSSVSNIRTWNLMIDVIAQTGIFPPNAPATAAALNSSFVVQGERRYWLHLAIDRFTGKIVDQQLEAVYE